MVPGNDYPSKLGTDDRVIKSKRMRILVASCIQVRGATCFHEGS